MTNKKKMNSSLQSLIVLLSICLVVAVLLAAINLLTAPKIEAANQAAEKEALRSVLDTATEFEKIEGDCPETVTAFYRDLGGSGYVAILAAKGYDSANPMKIAVGFDADGKILAVKVISASGETSGIGTKVTGEDFLAQFIGQDESLDGVDTISGATISSSAFREAVRDASAVVAKEVAS
ncbi:MAG: FMN-binding protein [Clostridia bacterium]|nr:FMN-binding protein [Clostridia bacterium]